jgi:WD40 repeat protein/Flp pilus assembly protein TadD
VLTACADGTVRIWDLAAGRLALPPLEHNEGVSHATFDADGRRAVTAGEDRTARVWDMTSGRSQGPLLIHAAPVRYAAFNADGQVVTAAEDNTLGEGEACVWDATTGNLVFQRPTAQLVRGGTLADRGVRRAWFSPDGRYLLALNRSGAGQVWDTATGQAVTGILELGATTINRASFSPDGRRLLTDTFLPEHSARLWEVAGKPLGELYRLLRPDNTATVWELPAGKRVASVGEPGSATAFRYASFGPDGGPLIFIHDGAAELRDAATGQVVLSFRKPGTAITGAALSPDGRTLATGSDDRTAQLWNAATGEVIPTPPQFQHGGQRWPPLFSPDGRLLVLGSPAGVRVWDAATGDPISPPLLHPAEVESVAFSPDGRLLLTTSDHAARVWLLSAEERSADDLLLLAQLLSCARRHAEGGRLMPSTSDELARAWDELRTKFPGDFTTPPQDEAAWEAEAARACERVFQWDAALFHFERLIAREPGRPDLHDRKGNASAELGRWAEAAAAFEKATALGTHRPQPWYQHALLRLHLADRNAYRRVCVDMLDHFGSSKDVAAAQLTAWTCSLANAPEDESARLVAIAERALAASPKDHSRLLTLGVALYRAGRNKDAVDKLNEALEVGGQEDAVRDCLFLALAHHRLGQAERARTYFERASRSIGQAMKQGAGSPRLSWSDRLEFALLRREVETVLNTPAP